MLRHGAIAFRKTNQAAERLRLGTVYGHSPAPLLSFFTAWPAHEASCSRRQVMDHKPAVANGIERVLPPLPHHRRQPAPSQPGHQKTGGIVVRVPTLIGRSENDSRPEPPHRHLQDPQPVPQTPAQFLVGNRSMNDAPRRDPHLRQRPRALPPPYLAIQRRSPAMSMSKPPRISRRTIRQNRHGALSPQQPKRCADAFIVRMCGNNQNRPAERHARDPARPFSHRQHGCYSGGRFCLDRRTSGDGHTAGTVSPPSCRGWKQH